MPENTPRRIIVAVTGASGALYAKRLIEALVHADNVHVHLIVSQTGRRLLHDELDMEQVDLAALAGTDAPPANLSLLPYKDVGACVASGSYETDGIVVVPCSNNKLAEFAHGLGDNLISRAVQVCLKERRPVIVVHREMPLGLIEIKNMLELAQAGAIICPANPGFYHIPQTVDDLVATVVGRILDLLRVKHDLHARWSGKSPLAKPETV